MASDVQKLLTALERVRRVTEWRASGGQSGVTHKDKDHHPGLCPSCLGLSGNPV